MEQELDMADNKQQELDTADSKGRVLEMADNKDQDVDNVDNNKGQLLATVDVDTPLASHQLEASFQAATSLDTDNAE